MHPNTTDENTAPGLHYYYRIGLVLIEIYSKFGITTLIRFVAILNCHSYVWNNLKVLQFHQDQRPTELMPIQHTRKEPYLID